MKIRTALFILGLTGIVGSCIPSLYPLYRILFLEGNRLRMGDRDIPLGQSYREQQFCYLQRKSKNGEV